MCFRNQKKMFDIQEAKDNTDTILNFLSKSENIRVFFQNTVLSEKDVKDIIEKAKTILKKTKLEPDVTPRRKKRRIYDKEMIKKCAICSKKLTKNDIIISKKCMCRTIQIAHKTCITEPKKKCLVCKKKHVYQKVEYAGIVYDVMSLD